MLVFNIMSGIACGGNWIIDKVKIIDCWPGKGDLANIVEETSGVGGSPLNVLTDLYKIGVDFPTFGIGCIGKDALGEEIRRHCREHNISTEFLTVMPDEQTSYTDVMTIQDTGERTFFHCRGANALFGPDQVSAQLMKDRGIRIFHLGYLLLLDTMDMPDKEYGTVAGRLLKQIRDVNIQTSLDVVSESSDRYQKIVIPTLPYVDHCIINEVEAMRITGLTVRNTDGKIDRHALKEAAARLMDYGVSETVVIHFPEGSLWYDKNGNSIYRSSLKIPKEYIIGTVGAGDAFCSGILLGIHEGWSPEECLSIANGTAAACLGAANTTDGVKSLEEIRDLCRIYPCK